MNKIIKEFCEEAIAKGKIEIGEKFFRYESTEKRIQYLLKTMITSELVPTRTHISTKSASESNTFRLKGNKLYNKKVNTNQEYSEIIKLYTQSIAFAPYPSKELSFGYGNRSACLFKLSLYSECLEDIERALALNYASDYRAKLFLRKAECLIILRKWSEAKDAMEKTQQWLNEMLPNDTSKKDLTTKLDTLRRQALNQVASESVTDTDVTDLTSRMENLENKSFHPIISFNPEVPCASDIVSIKYSTCHGRYITATRNIQPGEIIAIEKPYSSMLDETNIYTHCANCMKMCWTNIPCKKCIYAMYCSEKCRDDAYQKYHNVECDIFSALSYQTNTMLFSVRLAILALKEAEDNMERLKNMIEGFNKCDDPRKSNFSEDGKLHSNKYISVYNLIHNFEDLGDQDLFENCIIICHILYLLATKTEIFGAVLSDFNALPKNNNIIFFGTLILRHTLLAARNAFTFYEISNKRLTYCGRVLAPFCSLFNHSCSPNIIFQSRPESFLGIVAIYPIKKGEQLFVSYKPLFYALSKEERQETLKNEYYFECQCLACQNDWPKLKELQSYKTLEEEKQIIIEEELNKYYKYKKLIGTDIIYTDTAIEELIKIIKKLHIYAPIPARETVEIVEVLRYLYISKENKYKFPQIKEN